MNTSQAMFDISGSSGYIVSFLLVICLCQADHLLVCFYTISYFLKQFLMSIRTDVQLGKQVITVSGVTDMCASWAFVTQNTLFLTLKRLSSRKSTLDFYMLQVLMGLIRLICGETAVVEKCSDAFTVGLVLTSVINLDCRMFCFARQYHNL